MISNFCFCSETYYQDYRAFKFPIFVFSLRIYILFRTCCIEEYGFYNELSHSQNPNYKITRTFPAPLLVAGVISKEDGWNWLIYYMVSMDHVKKQQNQIFLIVLYRSFEWHIEWKNYIKTYIQLLKHIEKTKLLNVNHFICRDSVIRRLKLFTYIDEFYLCKRRIFWKKTIFCSGVYLFCCTTSYIQFQT